ncbi:GAF domain-containing protein [Deinococcus altitudinis]|uniref:GAF domain-containing protein n=1 Tax=Deinococcus altitudinis TaxID=468914 RepID=UPI003891274B
MTSPPGTELGLSASLAENLQNITEALAATGTQREVIEIVLAPAVQALGATAGIVLLVDQADQQLKIAGSQGYEDLNLTVWQEGKVEDHVLISDILRMQEALYFEQVGELKAAYPELERRTGALAAVSSAMLPMFLDRRPLGVIVLDFTHPHHFTSAERRFLKILAAQCAIALGRAEAIQTLEARVEERTRQLEEERAAQEVFVTFTEAVGSETELPSLVRQAITVLQSRFLGASIGYYEEEEGLWKARVWSSDMNPALIAVVSAGLPSETPIFEKVLRTRQPEFTDAWDAEREGILLSEEYGAVAGYPLLVNGELHSLLAVGLRDSRYWNEADRRLVRAVGRGLNLALERTQIARQLTIQNAELQARTQALEAFADLTRDLTLTTDPLLLIRRAQEVMLSMLADGAALYYVPEGDRWYARSQHGLPLQPELQASIDDGLPYAETHNVLIPWTTGQPFYQDVYDRDTDGLASVVDQIGATAMLPLRMEGELMGVLGFGLFQQRRWSSVDRVVLETVVQSLELALDRAAKTRRLQEERAALEAFAHFTEVVGSETDVHTLVRQAIALLGDVSTADSVYVERDGGLFKATVWNPQVDPALLARLRAGFLLERSSLAPVLQANTAAFIEHWNATAQWIEESMHFQAMAGYPIFKEGEVQNVLIIGSQTSATWSERDKGIFRAVGHSLNLALDRARHAQDLTDRTQQLEELTQELQAFTYSASHDLRTPVRHVMGFTELAQKALADTPNEKAYQHMEVVKQGALRMTAMIDGMLLLSRSGREALHPQLVNLDDLVLQAQQDAGAEFGDHPVHWDIGALPQVWGNRAMLQQVMTNLLSNAVKYSSTREVSQVRVWAQESQEEWTIAVKDNGVGFNPDYAQKLFGIFQRLHTERQFKGTGVGLATVRRIVLKHGGRVSAESVEHEGATFSFTLPKNSLIRP